MDFAGAQIGMLVEFGALSASQPGAVVTSAAQIPGPVDYQFLGASRLTARERWLLEQLRRRRR